MPVAARPWRFDSSRSHQCQSGVREAAHRSDRCGREAVEVRLLSLAHARARGGTANAVGSSPTVFGPASSNLAGPTINRKENVMSAVLFLDIDHRPLRIEHWQR